MIFQQEHKHKIAVAECKGQEGAAYFGNGYYCIKDASEGYFGKEPEDLTDYESTLLAGVPNAPSKYAPTVNLELAEKRQEQVVERLVACGLFTKERALETLAGSEKKG